MTTHSADASDEERAALRAARSHLVTLHKKLLDHERQRYEREHGQIETTHQHWQLLMSHPMFAWLRPLSGLIARFDERLAAKAALTSTDARQLAAEARELTTFAEERTEYQEHYHRALETSPEILAVHSDVARALSPLVARARS